MLDNTDLQIIDELSKNSRISMKDLGERIHMTGPAASARIEKLEDTGVIEGYSLKVNQDKLGYPVHAFITIITQSLNHKPYLSFIDSQKEYLRHNYKISGGGCYMLECRFPSNSEMSQYLEDLNAHANYKLSIVIDG